MIGSAGVLLYVIGIAVMPALGLLLAIKRNSSVGYTDICAGFLIAFVGILLMVAEVTL